MRFRSWGGQNVGFEVPQLLLAAESANISLQTNYCPPIPGIVLLVFAKGNEKNSGFARKKQGSILCM